MKVGRWMKKDESFKHNINFQVKIKFVKAQKFLYQTKIKTGFIFNENLNGKNNQ